MEYDPLTGEKLRELVITIEAAIGMRRLGMTKLGCDVTNLCEAAIAADRVPEKVDP